MSDLLETVATHNFATVPKSLTEPRGQIDVTVVIFLDED